MKKMIVLLLLIFLVSYSNTEAQRNFASVKIGYFDPSATDGGFILGYQGGKYIDDFLDIGWSVDWFNKNYVDKDLADQFQSAGSSLNEEINELRAKTNLHDFPVMFNAIAYFQAGRKINVYVNGALGADILLVFYRNYQNPSDDEMRFAFDFSWRLAGGVAYELGKKSELVAELSYHSTEPSWTYEVDDPAFGKKTFERLYDMSGVALKVGIKYYY
ncbi:MAG: hypothetical protein K9I71_07245 [Ignavibacteriales bacterium]|nr:hypothetical protein [Melioribacteraceae bacterium]MCF8306043.1 hypothetical protein [Ignavibacteriales bacterium]MCF8315902.1 hypothetical protein [Ignavibacteriales bacterium]MCF8437362.1 hypothetical protein [Ignavibacteriales bacterium]